MKRMQKLILNSGGDIMKIFTFAAVVVSIVVLFSYGSVNAFNPLDLAKLKSTNQCLSMPHLQS